MAHHTYSDSAHFQNNTCQWCEELSFFDRLKQSQKQNTETTINDFPLHSFYQDSRKLKKKSSNASIHNRLINPEGEIVYQSIIRKPSQKIGESRYAMFRNPQPQSSINLSSKQMMETYASGTYGYNSDNIGSQVKQLLHQSRSQNQFTPRNEEAYSHYEMGYPTYESRLTGNLHGQLQGSNYSESVRDIELKYLREECRYLRDRFYQHFKCAHSKKMFAKK